MDKLSIKRTKPKYQCFKCDGVAEYLYVSTFGGSKVSCHICDTCLLKQIKKSVAKVEKKDEPKTTE